MKEIKKLKKSSGKTTTKMPSIGLEIASFEQIKQNPPKSFEELRTAFFALLCICQTLVDFIKNHIDKSRKKVKTNDKIIVVSQEKPKRFSFPYVTIDLVLSLFYNASCSIASIPRILEVLNQSLGLGMKVPTDDTVSNWVKQFGLSALNQARQEPKQKSPYALVIDESMCVCGQILLLALKVPAEFQGKPLSMKDAIPVGMDIGKSHNSEQIKEFLAQITKEQGYAPEYVITDGSSTLKKACVLANLPRVGDISHGAGTVLGHHYNKAPDFVDFMKDAGITTFKNVMLSEVAYLLPPKQRVVARLMNVRQIVKWASDMKKVFKTLTQAEQEAFSFVPQRKKLVNELTRVCGTVQMIETELKTNGANWQNINNIIKELDRLINCKNKSQREKAIYTELKDIMKEMLDIIPAGKNYYASSDIIESVFGMFKYRQAHNKRNGVTTLVLTISGKLEFASRPSMKEIITALGRTKISDIRKWKKDNLFENQTTKRHQKLHTKKCS